MRKNQQSLNIKSKCFKKMKGMIIFWFIYVFYWELSLFISEGAFKKDH